MIATIGWPDAIICVACLAEMCFIIWLLVRD